MKYIDLRSDTVTHPTPQMRAAMASALVGDDGYREDPTVNRLQGMAAAMTGKEAGLLTASGTMGNLAAILTHCGRGDEVVMGAQSHTFLNEGGAVSSLGGVHSRQLMEQADGSLSVEDLKTAIRPRGDHQPVSRLITIENTHNSCGGAFLTPEYIKKASEFAHAKGLAVHMDGARIFNAAVAQNIAVKQLTGPVDSVTFCLSKGLCAPIGSVLCGSEEFIAGARRWRKNLGGGMRQAGIIAAAGIVALETMVDRLSEDHVRARQLAAGLKSLCCLSVDEPLTNLVYFTLSGSVGLTVEQINHEMKERGILVHGKETGRFRLVTHYWIDDAGLEKTLRAFHDVLK